MSSKPARAAALKTSSRKTERATDDDEERLPPTQRAPDDTTLIALEDLIVSPHNPRVDRPPEHLAEITANIATFKLLHPLIGYPAGQKTAITDGRRRIAALTALAEQGAEIGRVPVKLYPDWESAFAAALSAQTNVTAMNAGDEARAFSQMLDAYAQAPANATEDPRTAAVERIAKAFGHTTRHVEQRLKLASLHPLILDALCAERITLDQAKAWTTAPSSDSEAAALKTLGESASAATIRRHFAQGAMRGDDRLAKFVGEEAYRAAGGVITGDLFTDDDAALWLNPEIVQRLADEKLAAAAEATKAEGWADVQAVVEEEDYFARNERLGKARKPNAGEKSELGALKKEITALEKEQTKLYNSDDYDWRAREAIEDKIANAEQRVQRIEQSLIDYTPAERAKAGAVVSIGSDGALVVTRAVLVAKPVSTTSGGAKPSKHADRSKPTPAAPQAPITASGHETITRAAGLIVGRSIVMHRTALPALVAINAHLARMIFAAESTNYDSQEPLTLAKPTWNGPTATKDSDIALGINAGWKAEFDQHKAKLAPYWKKAGEVETALGKWSQDDLLDLLSFCVGTLICGAERDTHEFGRKKVKHARLAALGALAGAKPQDFVFDADLFKALRRDELDKAAKAIGISSPEQKTKGSLAAMCADKAPGAGWVHPIVADLCGAAAKPAAARTKKTSAPKKPAARKAAKKAVRT